MPFRKPVTTLIGCATFALCLTTIAAPALANPTLPPARAPATIPNLAPWVGTDGTPGPAAWQHAAHFPLAWETSPGHNRPAPVKTRVAVGYTKTALWLHFTADDPQPSNILVQYRRHDGFKTTGNLGTNGDYVGLIFSPFNDTQWGYEFFCNAGGTELDEFRQGEKEYPSFDAIWYCSAKLTPTGYVVTMQIPFHSLKFPHGNQPQTWRLLLLRNWARGLRHQIYQVRHNYNNNCTLCQAEIVHSATPILANGTSLQIIPSATVSRTDTRPSPSSGLQSGTPELSGSLDTRWAIRPDLVWSATLNPNFSQVAPDVLQSSVNQRFALYYPENRPFFQRGTWVFNTPGFDFRYGNQGRLVDTRQIADPNWASKIVGQVDNHALGALVADDAVTNILMPGVEQSSLKSFDFGTRDALLRYRYDFPGNSELGALVTNRSGGGYNNSVASLDGNWQLDTSDLLTGQIAYSDTHYSRQVANAFGIAPGRLTGNGWMLTYRRTRNRYILDVLVDHIGPDFRSDLGYTPQVGYNEAVSQFSYHWYGQPSAWWQEADLGVFYNWVQESDGGTVLDRVAQIYTNLWTVGQSFFHLGVKHEDQYYGGKTFPLNQIQLLASAQPLSWLGIKLNILGGGGVDYTGVRKGKLLSISPTLALAPGRHLKINFVGNFERMNVAGGRLYTANLYDLRIAWYFNPRIFVRAIAQEQDIRNNVVLYPSGTPNRNRTLATQWLFGYELNPWTSLFAGFGNNYIGSGETGILQQGRTWFLKLSYAFQL